MGLQGRSYRLVLSYGIVLWIVAFLISNCSAFPKPQYNFEDEDDFGIYAAKKGAPLITPTLPELTLDVKSNYTLRCEANEPITWSISAPQELNYAPYNTLDTERPFGSMLYLTDVTAEYVGYVYCIKSQEQNSEEEYDMMVEEFKAAKIYIFVKDENELLVPVSVPFINANQYEDITIPCKPTMPDTVVELITSDQKVYSSETTGRYDPKRGFVVQIQKLTEAGQYFCRPQQPSPYNEAEEVEFTIIYIGNESNDRELAPICDVFPINRNNRNNTINCTVFASEIQLKINKNNNTLSSLSPVNNTHLFFQSNNNNNKSNNNNNTIPSDILSIAGDVVNPVVVSRKSRSSSPSLTLTTARPTTRYQRQRLVGGASNKVDMKSNGGHDSDDDDGEADVDNDDNDDDEDDNDNDRIENGVGGDGANNNRDSLKDFKNNFDITTRKNFGLGITSALSTPHFEFTVTTESSYGVRVGKRHTTTSIRDRSHKSYGATPRPRSKTTHVAKPQIHSDVNGHAVEGATFNLTCSVETPYDVRFLMRWETPLGNISEGRLSYTKATIDQNDKTLRIGRSYLTVTNTQKTDEGYYKCIVEDHSKNKAHNTYLMTILKSGESYINMTEPNKYYTITTNASKNIMMNVNYRGHPKVTFNWYAPDGKLIQSSKKYEINLSNSSISLQINSVELFDTGEYVLRASNGIDEKELKFSLYVRAKPQVSIENVYVQAGETARLLCKTHAYPMAKIVWTYTPCNISPKWPSCKTEPVTFNSTRNSSEISKIERINELIFKPDGPGKMTCSALNDQGISSNDGYVLIGDISDNMTVYGVDENLKIAKGDEVIITCAALAYYYSADLDWFKDGAEIVNGSGVIIKTTFSDYSYKKIIKFKNIEDENSGSYECRARKVDSEVDSDSKFINIDVNEPVVPKMVQTNLGGDQHKRALGESLELVCKSEGIPKASITWYKDDEKLNANKNIIIMEDNSVLRIPYIKPNDEGLYKCVASNRLGDVESSSQVKITNMPGLKLGWIIAIIVFIAILIISIIYLGIRILKDREDLRQMKLAGLANFEEGALEQINPAMSLDEQADLLPYDRRFEFPRHKLRLGKKLGAGAFGVVLKAHAEGIIPEEKETVVAVKMVKRTADNEVIKALVSELKIMVHLGQHLNVVNLLGAVTKNIAKREVMVIVEYCRYGNVQNFLLRNRKRFINQINPITDKIDPTIVEQRFSGGDFELNRNSENDPRSGTRAGRPNSSNYLRQSDLYEGHVDSCATEQTVMTTVPEGEDQVMSNNSVQPAWRSNYKPDSTEAMSINTSDLVSWAFQVARGMDYLSSRKVLHGDLAARNILLCEDNVVKICDFGLARSMYKNDNYKKQGEAPLPIKWLALESLSDQIFSTYTDVWSFGIVLWEFFSLAKVPYPGMDANQTLYLKLKDGYRMEKPPYANEELYDIMLECWSANPESRPLFHELEKKFARLLGDEVTNHYVDLNEPYLKINTEHMQQSETDYLALMGSPNEMAPPPPKYVNGMILPEIRIDASDDYLQMSTKTGSAIFSPRPNDDYVKADNFTFSEQHSPTISNNLDSPVTKNRKKIGVPPEEIPMLQKSSNGINQGGSQSDSETEQSPGPKSVGKTFAQISRRPAETETSLIDTTDGNYVNVKSTDLSKKFMNSNGTKDAFSNPSYLMLKTVNEGRK